VGGRRAEKVGGVGGAEGMRNERRASEFVIARIRIWEGLVGGCCGEKGRG